MDAPVLNTKNTITLKDESILQKKKKLNLALNLLISALGISSLFIKFFLVDGLLAFRAFTVDGNIFTTVVSVIAVIVNIKELVKGSESTICLTMTMKRIIIYYVFL